MVPTQSSPCWIGRASASGYIIFNIIFGAILVFSLYDQLRPPHNSVDPGLWGLIWALSAALALINLWLAFFRLEITPDEIVYSRLFGRTVRIPLADIERIYFDTIPARGTSAIRFFVQARGGAPANINLKVFGIDTVSTLFAILESRGMEIDPPNVLQGRAMMKAVRKYRQKQQRKSV
jgi:hypothetical protein